MGVRISEGFESGVVVDGLGLEVAASCYGERLPENLLLGWSTFVVEGYAPHTVKRLSMVHRAPADLAFINVILLGVGRDTGLDKQWPAAMELNSESFVFCGRMTEPEVSNRSHPAGLNVAEISFDELNAR